MHRVSILSALLALLCLPSFAPAQSEEEIDIEGPVTYRAEAELVERVVRPGGPSVRQLRTIVYIRATGEEGARLRYSGCPVLTYIYDNAERTGTPRWTPVEYLCRSPSILKNIRKYEELRLETVVLPQGILGDSLKEGRYYVAARLRPNRASLLVPAGEVILRR